MDKWHAIMLSKKNHVTKTNTALFSQVEAKGKQKAKELGGAGEYERCGGGQGKDAQEVMEGGSGTGQHGLYNVMSQDNKK